MVSTQWSADSTWEAYPVDHGVARLGIDRTSPAVHSTSVAYPTDSTKITKKAVWDEAHFYRECSAKGPWPQTLPPSPAVLALWWSRPAPKCPSPLRPPLTPSRSRHTPNRPRSPPAGSCDRSSGQCQCFPGYTGTACDRLSCPNDCSGHGQCRRLLDLNNRCVAAAANKGRFAPDNGDRGVAFDRPYGALADVAVAEQPPLCTGQQ